MSNFDLSVCTHEAVLDVMTRGRLLDSTTERTSSTSVAALDENQRTLGLFLHTGNEKLSRMQMKIPRLLMLEAAAVPGFKPRCFFTRGDE